MNEEIGLFEDIYELLCGVGSVEKKNSVVAKVNDRIVRMRAEKETRRAIVYLNQLCDIVEGVDPMPLDDFAEEVNEWLCATANKG